MSARLISALLPLLAAACLFEAEEALEFPNYVQAEAVLPGEVVVKPVFNALQNYGIAAVGDTLYHMELNHGRVHGRTGLPGVISALGSGDGPLFALAGGTLCRVDGFQLTVSAELREEPAAFAVCGGSPLVVYGDGAIELRDPDELSVVRQGTVPGGNVVMAAGFPGIAVTASGDGLLSALSLNDMSLVASDSPGGEITTLNASGDSLLLYSCSSWNELAGCSPWDLSVDIMFTFPSSPSDAAAAEDLAWAFASVPGSGVQVCRASGEVAWRSGYADGAMVVLSEDCGTAMISWEDRIHILVK